MRTELHCICGHKEAIAPEAVKRQMRCKACGTDLAFSKGGAMRWFVVGDEHSSGLAAPLPLDAALKLGSASGSWIVLPGEAADARQVEMKLGADGGLVVKHVGRDKSKGTWINQARIYSGVLHDGDVLKIGDWSARLMAHGAVLALHRPVERDVIVEEPVDDEAPPPAESAVPIPLDAAESKRTRGRSLRIVVSLVMILFSGLYLMRSMIWPGVSAEMPRETTFYCPADGTVFRAAWSSGSPRCPQCGQVCMGPIRYKPESDPRKPQTTKPASRQTASAKPSNDVGKKPSGDER